MTYALQDEVSFAIIMSWVFLWRLLVGVIYLSKEDSMHKLIFWRVRKGSTKRETIKVQNINKKFTTWSLQVGSTTYSHCKSIIVQSHCKGFTSVYLPRVEEVVLGGLGSSLGGCAIVGLWSSVSSSSTSFYIILKLTIFPGMRVHSYFIIL